MTIDEANSEVIRLTKSQAAAVLHRLEIGDTIAEVFGDTDGMEHLMSGAFARAEEMAKELRRDGTITVDPGSELDEAILTDCIDGSTWCAIHEDDSYQKRQAVANALYAAAACFEQAFGLEPGDISVVTE